MTPGAFPAPCPLPCAPPPVRLPLCAPYPFSRKAVLEIFLSRRTCMFWGVFEDLLPLAWAPFAVRIPCSWLLSPFPLPLPCLTEAL